MGGTKVKWGRKKKEQEIKGKKREDQGKKWGKEENENEEGRKRFWSKKE